MCERIIIQTRGQEYTSLNIVYAFQLREGEKTADAPLNGDAEQEVEMHYSAMLQETIKRRSSTELLRLAG